MSKKPMWLPLLFVLPVSLVLGCAEGGKVDQGRVVEFDAAKRLVTIIRDVKNDSLNPDYSYLPPLTYALPEDPAETGPLPLAGGRLKLDAEKNQIKIYNPKTKNFLWIDFKPIEKKTGIDRDNPLVKNKKFPVVDKAKKTITLYSARQKILETIEVPDEYLEWPESTWTAGDEVRVYYKEEGKALRFMNITQTDIFKK